MPAAQNEEEIDIDPEGTRTARAATFLAEAMKSTGLHTCSLCVNECRNYLDSHPSFPIGRIN